MAASSAIALAGAGCSTQSSVTINTVPPSTPEAAAPAPTPAAPVGLDACTVVTQALIKDKLDLTVDAGVNKGSSIEGTSCEFNGIGSDKGAKIIVQFSTKPDRYYQPSIWSNVSDLTGIGDKGFYQNPDSGNANAQFVKNGQMAFVTIYARNNYTGVQVKAFMSAIADKF